MYRIAFKTTRGTLPLYIWEAIPPDTRYVALSMLATTTDAPPPQEAINCVPLAWCVPAQSPRKVLQVLKNAALYVWMCAICGCERYVDVSA